MMVLKSELFNEAVADYMTVVGAVNTTYGNYIFTVSDLAAHFEVQREYIISQSDNILAELNGEIISESSFYEDDDDYVFDLTFFGNYCNVDMEDD